METFLIKSVIRSIERLDTKFRLNLDCGIALELSFLETQQLEPKSGAKIEVELLNYIPIKAVINGTTVMKRSKTEAARLLKHLLSELKQQIQAEATERGRVEFIKRKSNLMAIFQHRTLLLQSFIGEKYSREDWLNELRAMELAQTIYLAHRNGNRLKPLTFFDQSHICKAFPYAAEMSSEQTGYAILLFNRMLEDEKQSIVLDDFEMIKNKISYSRILRLETLKGDSPSVSNIISYHQSLLYGNNS